MNLKKRERKNGIMKFPRIRSVSRDVLRAIDKGGIVSAPNSLHKSGIETNVKLVLAVVEHHDSAAPLMSLAAIILTAI
jgi:hypothetical protein